MHNITEIDKQEGIEQAWHRLTVIREGFSLDENWLREWDVKPERIYIRQNGDSIELPFRQLVCTDDGNILVGYPYNPETYRPITNEEFVKLAQECVSGTGHKIISAGSVKARGRTFMSFKIDGLESFEAGGRKFDAYLNFGNGHDKSSVLWVNTSNVCTVCDNTFSANLYSVMRGDNSLSNVNGEGKVSARLRHTINVEARFPEITKLVDQAVGVQAEFAAAFNSLTEKKVDEETARDTFAGFVAAPDVDRLATRGRNIVDTLADLFGSGRGNRGENRADMFSAVTDYYTNIVGRDTQKRFASSEFGNGATRKRDFWKIVNNDEVFAGTAIRGSAILKDS